MLWSSRGADDRLAFQSNTRATADEVPAFLEKADFTPAVLSRKSLASKDHIISMIDGKPYKTLRRHLSRHGLTPEQYRERYGLRSDYPMARKTIRPRGARWQKKIGLGRKPAKASSARGSKAES